MFSNIFSTFANCFKIPELKSRILFTLGLLAVARVLAYVPIPGINGAALEAWMAANSHGAASILGMYNRFAGGAYGNCAVGALGIMPYVSASIILTLVQAVFPRLSKLAREEGGRAKIIQYGRYLTIPLCIGQGAYFANSYLHPGKLFQGFPGKLVVMDNVYLYYFLAVTVMTTATLLLMWLGEQITERGIGNGVSLIITVGIVAGLPYAGSDLVSMFKSGSQYHFMGTGLLLIALLVGVIAGIIAITQAQRKVPVQYASRMVGRKMYQGGTNYLPLQVNQSNVMPIIFASSILMFPGPLCNWMATYAHPSFLKPPFQWLSVQLNYGSPFYLALFSILILFFSYFWVATTFNEIQIADDLKKNGGYIPGVRPGQSTSDYLHKAMSRLTLAGAIFLTVIAVIPIILYKQVGVSQNVSQFFGGTSILISVGVLLNTMRQVESHLMMRHYDGFLKKGRVRGRF
ncbi:MAG TPA: preprotein translocase subunit SecY [Candidatus Acidoferrum sp.]|jgi:preprotein translocase subunit SecY|nr:preprotein translocase subunit SecY [Candidatus Acidoferrum sp.]